MLIGGVAGAEQVVATGDVLWDNGPPDGTNGYSNATYSGYGVWRALQDDFRIPAGESWIITGFRWQHVWNTAPPGSGERMHLAFRRDAPYRGCADADGPRCSQPGEYLGDPVTITSYTEVPTGVTWFNRAGAESWVTFEPRLLPAGHYWFLGAIGGPDNNYWLVREKVSGGECWYQYDDAEEGPGRNLFGVPADLNFMLIGEAIVCPGDVDESGAVGLSDLLAVLAAWGSYECPPYRREDLDGDCRVDLDDLLALLGQWGACG